MKVTIKSIKLKGPHKYFALSFKAWRIVQQLKSTNYEDFKKKGLWTTHYTMTLWKAEDEMRKFASSGPHKEVMKSSQRIAKEIRTLKIDADELPTWSAAVALLEKGKVIHFN